MVLVILILLMILIHEQLYILFYLYLHPTQVGNFASRGVERTYVHSHSDLYYACTYTVGFTYLYL